MATRTETPSEGLGSTAVKTALDARETDRVSELKPELWLGRLLSHYRVEERLGAGGMGVLYRATDLKLGRSVAIKFLSCRLATDQAAQARFLHEARTASALDHPNIGTIYEVGEQDGELFIAMALYQGETLRERLQRGRLAVEEALTILRQVLLGLAAAHRAGIVHRDIKPANLFVTRDGTVKILDFGLAKLLSESHGQTQLGQALGTMLYMSPEQLQGKPVDSRADLWSLGVVAYEILAGASPFQADSSAAIAIRILHEEPPRLASVPGVPDALDGLVSRLLRKDPSQRPKSASEVLQQLDPSVSSPLTSRPRLSAAQWLRWPKRHGILAPLTAAIFALGTTGLYWYAQRAAPGSGRKVKSLAVLPFLNAGENPDTEYLSDGIAESLIDNLSQIPELQVIARTTAFRYKGRELDFAKIRRELSVDAVLTGRVQQRGDTLDVHADLVNLGTGSQLWGAKYKPKLSELLAVEAGIAKAISDTIRPHLSAAVQHRVTKLHTESPEAYQLYLRGRHEWNKRTPDSLRMSIDYFNQAIEKDPGYALAYAGLADVYSVAQTYLRLLPKEVLPRAKAAATRAVELDQTLAEAHSALAVVKVLDWDWPGAEREFKRAIELNPGYPTAHYFYGFMYLLPFGRFEEAIAEMKRAVELDPFSAIANGNLGWALEFAGKYDEAIAQYEKAVQIAPDWLWFYVYHASAYSKQGRYEEAIAALEKVPASMPEYVEPKQLAELRQAYAMSGEQGYWRKRMEFLKNRGNEAYLWPRNMASLYARSGKKDQAFEWLERAYEGRDEFLRFVKIDPAFDSLRSDPRYADVLRRIGLPP